ncbi:MAG: phosphopentomutase [Anaeroplasmataceae bacterium]
MEYKRVFLIVADSLGVGYLNDAYKYNDEGSNTLLHILENNKNLELNNLKKLGLYNLIYDKKTEAIGSYGKCKELSNGKDTLTGHYEIMGLLVKEPFMTFTDTGFPKELIEKLEKETGYKVIGNCSASGTEIIKDLGEEHIKTKALIVYTSSDSVLQIACHEKYFGLEELYRVCNIARKICLEPKWKVARIIARPFIGEKSSEFVRTSNRHDYALDPFDTMTLDNLSKNNIDVYAFGKISDIYNNRGITKSIKTTSNLDGINKYIDYIKNNDKKGLYFINLVDFDSLWGHRRNVIGYGNALAEFDAKIPIIIDSLKDDDLLIITADHGNDPTWSGTDHTREYTPLLVYNKNLKSHDLGIRESFADIGESIAENFKVSKQKIGKSFLEELNG